MADWLGDWLGKPVVSEYKGLDLTKLPLNHAYVIANTSYENVGVYSQKDDCYNCPFQLLKSLQTNVEDSWVIDTSVQTTLRVITINNYEYLNTDFKSGLICQMRPTLGEYGVYRIEAGLCSMNPAVPPVSSFLPLLIIGLATSIFLTMAVIKSVQNQIKQLRQCDTKDVNQPNSNQPEQSDKMTGLHFMRGIIFCLLIFALTGGGGYPIFQRKWGELSIADYLLFMIAWTMGVYLCTLIDESIKKGQKKCIILGHIAKRSCILIMLGVLLDATVYIPGYKTDRHSMALWSPLQRLGIAYLAAGSVYMTRIKKFQFHSKLFISKILENLFSMVWCWLMIGVLISAILVLMLSYMTFNCQGSSNIDAQYKGYDFSNNISDVLPKCDGGYINELNQVLIGQTKGVYYMEGYYGFSSGLLGIVTTIVYTMLGLKTGIILLHYETNSVSLKLWTTWGSIFFVLGAILTGVGYIIQFNLWPISTIFILSALSTFLYTISYKMTESDYVGKFLTVTGTSFMILLMGHIFFSKTLPTHWGLMINNHILYLLENACVVILWCVVGYILKRNNIRIYL